MEYLSNLLTYAAFGAGAFTLITFIFVCYKMEKQRDLFNKMEKAMLENHRKIKEFKEINKVQ